MKKFLLILLLIFICFSLYCRFFVFSYDLDNDPFELYLPAYYSDQYLNDKGFFITNRHEQYFSMAKKDIYTLSFGNRTFTDSLKLLLNSSRYIKPLYLFYTFEVDSIVDIAFINFLNIEPDSVENNEIPVWQGSARFQQSYFTLPIEYEFKRVSYRDIRLNFRESKITYWFYKNGKYPEQNFIEKLIQPYVSFLYNL